MVFEDNSTKAIDYLEKKYGEEFVGIKWYDSNVYGCYPIANEDWIVKVYFLREDGKSFIRDDYYGWLKKDEYLEMTHKIIRQWFPDEEMKVFSNFSSSYFKDEYTTTTPLMDAMVDNPLNFISTLSVFVAADDGMNTNAFELRCHNLVESLRLANYNSLLVVYAVRGDNLETIEEDNYSNYFLRNNRSKESGYLYEYRSVIKITG